MIPNRRHATDFVLFVGLFLLPSLVIAQDTFISQPPPIDRQADWDAVRDFREDRNPNGVWSYGQSVTVESGFIPFPSASPAYDQAIATWYTPGESAVIKHHNGKEAITQSLNPPDLLSGDYPIDPGLRKWVWNGPSLVMKTGARFETPVLRFTSPRDGRYRLHCHFYVLCPVVLADVAVQINEMIVWRDVLMTPFAHQSATPPYDREVLLRTGETVDMNVGSWSSGNHDYSFTGADFKVWRMGDLPADAPPSSAERNGVSPYSPEEERKKEAIIRAVNQKGALKEEYRLLEGVAQECHVAGYRLGESRALWELCWIDGMHRDWKRGEERIRQLVTIEDERGDTDRAARARETLGALLIADGRRGEGENYFRQAFALREQRGDHVRAVVLRDMYCHPAALIPLWNPVLSLLPSPLVSWSADTAYIKYTRTLSSLGFNDRAIGLLETFLEKAHLHNKAFLTDICYRELIPIYLSIGAYAKAHAAISAAEREGQMAPVTAQNYRGQLALLESGAIPGAPDAFNRSWALLESTRRATRQDYEADFLRSPGRITKLYQESKAELPTTLEGLATVDRLTGHPERALTKLMRAFLLRDVDGPEWERTLTCREIGRTYEALGDDLLALHWYRTTRQRLTRNFAHPADWITGELDCAHAFERVGRYAEAEECYQVATGLTVQTVQRSAAPFQVSGFYLGRNPWAEWAGFRLRRGSSPLSTLLLLEQGRALWMPSQKRTVYPESTLLPEDARQNQILRQAFQLAGQQIRELDSQVPPSEDATRQAILSYHEAENNYLYFEDYLRTRYPAFRDPLGATPLTARNLTRFLERHRDTLYLSYVVSEKGASFCLALSATTGVRQIPLRIDRKALETGVQKWQQAILESSLRSSSAEQRLARELYQSLVAPCERAGLMTTRVGIRRLVVVPDGILRDLPFSALTDSAGRRLIERYPISIAPSLTTLQNTSQPPLHRNPRVLCASYPTIKPHTFHPSMLASLRGPFTPLRFAEGEATAVRKLFPTGTLFIGEKTAESAIKNALPDADIVHFATHAYVDRANALRSYLLLAPESGKSLEDGRFEAREISAIPMKAQLAVLSACSTGVVQPQLGNGTIGFAWGFAAAGCPSVVASQWEVDDAATSKLMVTFYRRLRLGNDKDTALQAAIIERLRDPQTHRPFYWAAWHIIGTTDPLIKQ